MVAYKRTAAQQSIAVGSAMSVSFVSIGHTAEVQDNPECASSFTCACLPRAVHPSDAVGEQKLLLQH